MGELLGTKTQSRPMDGIALSVDERTLYTWSDAEGKNSPTKTRDGWVKWAEHR